ncbi:phenylalanine--tRNA ligase subunit beta [Alphaproteobacteria bacterium]|nr:phenylalanine--tRNA ligase subunit beta [Alphaproteobacteria bacterium]
MKFTWNWLLDHLQTDKNINEIVEALPKLGLEVASVINLAEELKEFVSVKVLEVKKHPNADTLNLCKVFDGNNTFSVVCGASNVKAGMIGVFANVDTYVPGINLTLKKAKIRGESSEGMLCSEKELTLSDNHEGIIELPKDSKIGLPVRDVMELTDPVIEIEITPNRGDCLGVRGIARDLAAAGMGVLKDLEVIEIEGDFESLIDWKIDLNGDKKNLCPKIFGRSFQNLVNVDSPSWLKKRLLAVDQRPISSLVDITNYIMIDIGRPLHAYDVEKIVGNTLIIKEAKQGEKFFALNGNEYELDQGMLVIADSHGIDDLAGIMGGERTGVTNDTTKMFLEAAIFDPISIANTGRKLNINSDARYRFERGLDYDSPDLVMHYAASMVNRICGGTYSKIVKFESIKETKSIIFNPDNTYKLTGVEIENQVAKSILEKLGFLITINTDIWSIIPPSWRPDIDGVSDIVEEIIRVNGYDYIPSIKLPRKNYIAKPAMTIKHRQTSIASKILANRGYSEVITFSFLNEVMAKQFNGGMKELVLVNPISSELTHMRPSVIPTLLVAAQRNLNVGIDTLSLFEVGPIFKGDKPDDQISTISGLRLGSKVKRDWKNSSKEFDFYDVKLDVLKTLEAIGANINSLQTYENTSDYFHPGRSAVLKIGQKLIANLGEIHPGILDFYGFEKSILAFEIFYENIPMPKKVKVSRPMLKMLPLQSVTREFAFVIDETTPAEKLVQIAKSTNNDLIKEVLILDVYKGENIPNGKKSIAIKIIIQPNQETLTDDDLEKISSDLINVIDTKLSGSLRSQ